MKIKVNKPTELEITHIEIQVPIDSEDQIPDDFPFISGEGDARRFTARIQVDSGQIENWPESAGTRRFYAFPRDRGTYRLLGPDGAIVSELKEEYVPNQVVPGNYGDSIELEIDHRGRITNWPRRVELAAFFEKEERP